MLHAAHAKPQMIAKLSWVRVADAVAAAPAATAAPQSQEGGDSEAAKGGAEEECTGIRRSCRTFSNVTLWAMACGSCNSNGNGSNNNRNRNNNSATSLAKKLNIHAVSLWIDSQLPEKMHV